MNMIVIACALAVLGTTATASANTASCGESFKIKRKSWYRVDAATCSVQQWLEPKAAEALENARSKTLARMEQFDATCSQRGGRAVITNTNESVQPYIEQQFGCSTYNERGRRFDYSYPNCQGSSWCDIEAKSEITKTCECN